MQSIYFFGECAFGTLFFTAPFAVCYSTGTFLQYVLQNNLSLSSANVIFLVVNETLSSTRKSFSKHFFFSLAPHWLRVAKKRLLFFLRRTPDEITNKLLCFSVMTRFKYWNSLTHSLCEAFAWFRNVNTTFKNIPLQ